MKIEVTWRNGRQTVFDKAQPNHIYEIDEAGAVASLPDDLSDDRDTWIAFARTGNPNQPKMPRWPAFNTTDRPTMVFNTESRVVNDPIKEQRLMMWKALGYDS